MMAMSSSCSTRLVVVVALACCCARSVASELIVNGGFEFPAIPVGVTYLAPPFTPAFALELGWETSEPSGFEFWRAPTNELAVAGEGANSLELNHFSNTAIWQRISPLAGTAYRYSFMHRARSQASESIRFELRDTAAGDLIESRVESTGPVIWVTYSGEFLATGSVLEFRITAISPTESWGNLLDGISVVPVPVACPDLSGNGEIDSLDLAMLLTGWGTVGGEFGGDVNADGVVDGADLSILLLAWGPCS